MAKDQAPGGLASPNPTFNGGSVLERDRVGNKQAVLVSLVLAALVIDGLDVQVLALVSPLVLTEWNITKGAFAPTLAAALVGMAAGSVGGGWLGDRLGRRKILIGSTLLFGAMTVLAATVETVRALAILRFLSGVGFGAAMPNGMALASEWMPPRLKTRVVTLLSIGIPLGGMIGAPLTFIVAPAYGWRGCFVVCGLMTLVIAVAMLKGIAESPAFLLARRRRGELTSVDTGGAGATSTLAVAEIANRRDPQGRGARLLTRDNLPMNLGIWLTAFGVASMAYAIAAWGPILFSSNGLTLTQAIQGSFYHNAAAIAAALSASRLLGRYGSKQVLSTSLAGGLILIMTLAYLLSTGASVASDDSHLFIYVAMAGLGVVAGLANATIYSLLSLGYPASCRTTGIGTGIMAARIGAIAMVLSGGALLDLRPDGLALFGAIASMLTLAVTGSWVLDRHIPGIRTSRATAS